MEQLMPPQEKELPAPNEKLLRSPTFLEKLLEKQGKTAKWLAISSIILFVFIFTLALLIKSQKSTTVPIQPTHPPISTAPTINTIEISADKKECKEKFLLWCSNCQSNNWQGVLNSEINVCLSDSLDIHLPKSATCESSKKDCCLVISEGKRTQYYKCLENIDKTDFKPKDETVNWQTYRNEEYRFEMKYPEDFKKQKSESGTILLEATKTEGGSSYYFRINVMPNYKIDQIISKVADAEEIIIGDHSGYKYFYTEGAGMSEVALIQAGQDTLSIAFDSIGNGHFATANDRKIYVQNFIDQILSTFKFLDQTPK